MKQILLITLLISSLVAFGQKQKKSTGEYQLNLSKSEFSPSEACDYCKEMARIQAIEKIFGTVVVQGNTTYIRNTQTGEKVETKQVFNMMAETYVNGDWIKTIKEDCSNFVENDEFWIRCKVKGVVQEWTRPQLDLKVAPLDCEDKKCESTAFKDGESFYLYLKSPVAGYVSVYLADEHVAQRVFPYRNMPEEQVNGVKVKADREYILFSRIMDVLDLRSYVDEYELYAESEQDQNRIYVIYSEKPLVKPALYEASSASDSQMPMQLSAEDFQRWLAQNRQYDNGVQVERVDITISKD